MSDSYFCLAHELPIRPDGEQPPADASWQIHARGYLVVAGALIDANSPRAQQQIFDAFRDESGTLNGSFAAVFISPDGGDVILVTDPVGTVPLYYAIDGRRVICGTDALAVARACPKLHFSLRGLSQIVAFSYALEQETIFEEVNEVSAATRISLRWDLSAARVVRSEDRYWRYTQQPEIGAAGFPQEFDHVAGVLKQRYSDYLSQSRLPPLIHLSGGGDSRLLLSWMADVPGLATATYGSAKRKSQDAFVARSLSRQAGITRHFAVPISGREAADPQLRRDAIRACGLRTFPLHGMGPGLLRRGLPPSQWNHLLGHAADFVAGSHIRDRHFNQFTFDERVREIVAAHGVLFRFRMTSDAGDVLRSFVNPEMLTDPIARALQTTQDAPPWLAFQIWNLENRQRRLILSHGAAPRNWGQTVLPFWDLDFVQLFAKCDVAVLRAKEATYDRSVMESAARVLRRKPRIEWPINDVPISKLLLESLVSGVPLQGAQLLGYAAYNKFFRKPLDRKRALFAYFSEISEREAQAAIEAAFQREAILSRVLTPSGKQRYQRDFWMPLYDLALTLGDLRTMLPQIAD